MHQARKRFGQNFLIDPIIIADIIATINPQPKQHIVEVGPGLGALTRYLIQSQADIDAVELDRDLVVELQHQYARYKNFTLHSGDILTFPLQDLLQNNSQQKLRIVGNLPYNISTPLLFHLFEHIEIIADMYFMLQKEVAQRLVAMPNTKDYGRMSVTAQYYCSMQIVVDVPPTAFDPQPKVDSCVVRFTPHYTKHQIVQHAILQNVVTAAFGQRRKTIGNSLKKLISAQELLQLNIDPLRRAENITLEEYIKISNYLATLK